VTIEELPFVWHCVVVGATFVHCGAAAAIGAIAIAADSLPSQIGGLRRHRYQRWSIAS